MQLPNVVSSNTAHGDVYSIQHLVIKFVSDVRQVSGFLPVLRFPPPIKRTATLLLKYCWNVRFNTPDGKKKKKKKKKKKNTITLTLSTYG